MLYNAQLLDWHPGQTGADVLFVDYENVESVVLCKSSGFFGKDVGKNLTDVVCQKNH